MFVMGERKVLNFYVSPDFDHSIIPKTKRDWDKTVEVRMMLPFSMRCNTCGEYMYRGKKFNSRKENVKEETYLGIRILRFYIKCSVCSAEITFKTDPKNSDYVCEYGASRNFEVWKDTEQAIMEAKKEREDEDKSDSIKSLENRTLDSKLEMDVLDALDEMKAINQRHERVDTDSMLESLQKSVVCSADFPDVEEAVRNAKFKRSLDSSLHGALVHQLQKNMADVSSESDPQVKFTKKKKSVPVESIQLISAQEPLSSVSCFNFADYGSSEEDC